MSDQRAKHWLETRWLVKKDISDTFQLKLQQMGSLGSYENLPLNPSQKKEQLKSEIMAYFADNKSVNAFAKKIKKLEQDDIKLIVIKRIPQGNWATEWKKYFKPFSLTPNIVIHPSWETYQKKESEKVITLDPGMAFGTGLHDTTRFCAELICQIKKTHPHLSSFLDVGCGSGILSIIARTIGFEKVVGIDTDNEAITTSHENLERNPLTKPIDFFVTNGSLNYSLLKTSDVVAANIIAETLSELKDDLIRLTKQNGFLILSGILPERTELIKENFKSLKLIELKTSKEWHACVYCKK